MFRNPQLDGDALGRRVSALLQTVLSINQMSPYQCKKRFNLDVSRSTLHQVLLGTARLSLPMATRLINFCVAQLAQFGVNSDDVWQFVATGNGDQLALEALMLARICHVGPTTMPALLTMIARREADVSRVISVHQFIPDFLMPESVLDRETAHAIASKRSLSFRRLFQAGRRDRFLLRNKGSIPQMFAIVTENSLRTLQTRSGALANWTMNEMEEAMANLHDAVQHRNLILLILPDYSCRIPQSMRQSFLRYEESTLFGEDLLVKRFADATSYLLYQRGECPQIDAHINNHQRSIEGLLNWLKALRN